MEDWKCKTPGCGRRDEVREIISDVPGAFPLCDCCNGLMEKVLTAHAGYKIKGNNSASQRPKQAGSFNRRKK
jgi:hypothetical protein